MAEWLTMAEAMTAIKEGGKHPEEAAAILVRALARGTLLGSAEHILAEYSDGTTQEDRDHVVSAGVLDLNPMPPLGHPFWRTGDVLVRPPALPDCGVVQIAGRTIIAPPGALASLPHSGLHSYG